jgi:hypothetical protein
LPRPRRLDRGGPTGPVADVTGARSPECPWLRRPSATMRSRLIASSCSALHHSAAPIRG